MMRKRKEKQENMLNILTWEKGKFVIKKKKHNEDKRKQTKNNKNHRLQQMIE